MNLQSAACKFCSSWTFFLVRRLSRILFFSWLCYVPLCHWPVEQRERAHCICLHRMWLLTVLSLQTDISWQLVLAFFARRAHITMHKLKEIIFTEKFLAFSNCWSSKILKESYVFLYVFYVFLQYFHFYFRPERIKVQTKELVSFLILIMNLLMNHSWINNYF